MTCRRPDSGVEASSLKPLHVNTWDRSRQLLADGGHRKWVCLGGSGDFLTGPIIINIYRRKKTKGIFEISDLKLTKARRSFLLFKIIISFTEILKENKENEKKI